MRRPTDSPEIAINGKAEAERIDLHNAGGDERPEESRGIGAEPLFRPGAIDDCRDLELLVDWRAAAADDGVETSGRRFGSHKTRGKNLDLPARRGRLDEFVSLRRHPIAMHVIERLEMTQEAPLVGRRKTRPEMFALDAQGREDAAPGKTLRLGLGDFSADQLHISSERGRRPGRKVEPGGAFPGPALRASRPRRPSARIRPRWPRAISEAMISAMVNPVPMIRTVP